MNKRRETYGPNRRCICCGCTDATPCIFVNGDPCEWLISDPPVCNSLGCLQRLASYWEQAIAQQRKEAPKKSREGRTLTGPLIAAIRSARQARLCLQRQLERSQPLWGSVLATDPDSR